MLSIKKKRERRRKIKNILEDIGLASAVIGFFVILYVLKLLFG